MRKILVAIIVGLVVTGCNVHKGYNTDKEMYDIACGMYQEHLFEFGIDSTLFMPVVIKDLDDSTKVYRWAAVTPNGDTTGFDVKVARSREIEPEFTLFGPAKAAMALPGTERSKEGWFKK